MVARVRRIMRSRVPCRIWMGMFFTWRSSDHSCHLDVKWKPQDEIHGADNTVERRDHSRLQSTADLNHPFRSYHRQFGSNPAPRTVISRLATIHPEPANA